MISIFKIKMLISAQLKKATADSVDAALLTSNINQGINVFENNICFQALNITGLTKRYILPMLH